MGAVRLNRQEREARMRADSRNCYAREQERHGKASLAGKAARDRNLRARYGNEMPAAAMSWGNKRKHAKVAA